MSDDTAAGRLRQGSRKLDTGMTVDEAIRKARIWWADYRGAIRPTFNLTADAPKVFVAGRKSPAFVSKSAPRQDLKSGILSGLSWDLLTPDEQFRVVKAWHENHVRDPMRPDFEYRRELARAYRGRHGVKTGKAEAFDAKAGKWGGGFII